MAEQKKFIVVNVKGLLGIEGVYSDRSKAFMGKHRLQKADPAREYHVFRTKHLMGNQLMFERED